MRVNDRVQVGQVWRSSDPRRLSAFRILEVYVLDQFVHVESVYPQTHRAFLRVIALEAFKLTGPKGYHRIS